MIAHRCRRLTLESAGTGQVRESAQLPPTDPRGKRREREEYVETDCEHDPAEESAPRRARQEGGESTDDRRPGQIGTPDSTCPSAQLGLSGSQIVFHVMIIGP